MSSPATNCTVRDCSCTEFLPSHNRPTHCAIQACQHIQGAHLIPQSEQDDDLILLSQKPLPKKSCKLKHLNNNYQILI